MKPTVVLFDIDYTLFDTHNFKNSQLTEYKLYPEVLDVISSLKEKAILGIFSEGEIEFQLNKLRKLELDPYFLPDDIHIFQKKREAINAVFTSYARHQQNIFLVDDKISVLEEVKKRFPHVVTVWIKRGYYAINEKNENHFNPDYSVDSLKELISIIQ